MFEQKAVIFVDFKQYFSYKIFFTNWQILRIFFRGFCVVISVALKKLSDARIFKDEKSKVFQQNVRMSDLYVSIDFFKHL